MKRKPRKKAPDLRGVITGVAWYSPEQWEQMKAVVPDPENLEPSYEEWVSMASAALVQLKEAGIVWEKVLIEAEEFVAWCEEGQRALGSSARSQFAAEKIRQRYLQE